MIFAFTPDAGASMDLEPNVDLAKFGDGFEQRGASSLNTRMAVWTLKFTREAKPAYDFLKERGAVESFAWTNPFGEMGLYVCRKWNLSHVDGDLFALACDFEQVAG